MAKIKDTTEAWDDRTLGADESFVQVAEPAHRVALDEALGLQSISIRLPQDLIRQYKLIAQYRGVGYQPLMRDVMARFVPNALKEIMLAEQEKAVKAVEKASPASEPLASIEVAEKTRVKKAAWGGRSASNSPLRRAFLRPNVDGGHGGTHSRLAFIGRDKLP